MLLQLSDGSAVPDPSDEQIAERLRAMVTQPEAFATLSDDPSFVQCVATRAGRFKMDYLDAEGDSYYTTSNEVALEAAAAALSRFARGEQGWEEGIEWKGAGGWGPEAEEGGVAENGTRGRIRFFRLDPATRVGLIKAGVLVSVFLLGVCVLAGGWWLVWG